MSRPTTNDLVRRLAAVWCLLSSCSHHPGWFGPDFFLGGAGSHHQYPTLLFRLRHLVATILTISAVSHGLADAIPRAATSTVAVPAFATVTTPLFSWAPRFQRFL